MRRVGVLAAMLLLTTLGCALTDDIAGGLVSSLRRLRQGKGPTITHHSSPAVSVDFTPFEAAGCEASQYSASCLDCEPGSALAKLGCDRICEPDSELGALTPAYPIAECTYYPEDSREPPDYLRCGGGLRPACERFLVWKDGAFEPVTSADDFRTLFAPVETPEEALAFAMALSGHSARYGIQFDPEYEYYVGELEDTHVDTDGSGFRVHLYLYRWLGCGPHETYAILHTVTTDGQVSEDSREAVFRDPREDDLCAD